MRGLHLLILLIILFSSCSTSYDVNIACDRMSETHYHIKWEIEPHINGGVRIYVSDNPDHFDRTNPVKTAMVKDNFVGFDLPPANKRQYFLVCFSDKYECVTAPKKVLFNRVENFRDFGGYQSANSKHIKWGSIFRSGNLDIADSLDLEKLKGLNVKTFVDLRMVRDTSALTKIKNYIPNYKYIKVDTGMGDVHEPVIGENFSVKQARKAIYKTYNNMIRLNDEAIKDIFETLANEENYPVILGSKYGMYQTSVVSALLLAALDVPESVIYEDYLLTNEAFNTKVLLDYASGFSEEVQDAVVCLTTCDDKYLKKAFDQLRRDHNSINDYFTSLGIDEDHRQKLRNLLLK